MQTAASIIETKGGASAVAAALNRKAGVVRVWKHRNHFPRAAWPDLLAVYPDLTMAELLNTEAGQHTAAEGRA